MTTTAKTTTVGNVAAWHAMSQAEVVKRLDSNSQKGLSPSEASARFQKYGPNRLPEGRKRGHFTRFFAQFNNILV
jgi:magnesium-transporting ATPase (P-type)